MANNNSFITNFNLVFSGKKLGDYAEELKNPPLRQDAINKLKTVVSDANNNGTEDDATKVLDNFISVASESSLANFNMTIDEVNKISTGTTGFDITTSPVTHAKNGLGETDSSTSPPSLFLPDAQAEQVVYFLNSNDKGEFEELATQSSKAAAPEPVTQAPTTTSIEETSEPMQTAPTQNTSTETILGIPKAKFGSLLTTNETYPSWKTTNMIQAALNEQIENGAIDGYFLVQDGIFGAHTAEVAQAWLNKNTNTTLFDLVNETIIPNNSEGSQVILTQGYMLDIGSAGHEVKELQQKLNSIDILEVSLAEDGNYGIATKEAVRAFQENYNKDKTNLNDKLEVDGVAGPNTIAAMGLLFESG